MRPKSLMRVTARHDVASDACVQTVAMSPGAAEAAWASRTTQPTASRRTRRPGACGPESWGCARREAPPCRHEPVADAGVRNSLTGIGKRRHVTSVASVRPNSAAGAASGRASGDLHISYGRNIFRIRGVSAAFKPVRRHSHHYRVNGYCASDDAQIASAISAPRVMPTHPAIRRSSPIASTRRADFNCVRGTRQ